MEYLSIAVNVLLLLLLTLGGGLNMLHEFFATLFDDPLIHGMLLIISVFLIMTATEIPLSYYRTFVIEEQFGFNKMTPAMFFVDLLKQAGVGLLLGAPLLFGMLWSMEKMGEYWWLYAWFGWVVFNLFVLAIFPTWIAPLFNKFTPLEDASLKTRIEQLLNKCGFKPADCLLWMVHVAAVTATLISPALAKLSGLFFLIRCYHVLMPVKSKRFSHMSWVISNIVMLLNALFFLL